MDFETALMSEWETDIMDISNIYIVRPFKASNELMECWQCD
jgi:hypothetical protein